MLFVLTVLCGDRAFAQSVAERPGRQAISARRLGTLEVAELVQNIMNTDGGGVTVAAWPYDDFDSLYVVRLTNTGGNITLTLRIFSSACSAVDPQPRISIDPVRQSERIVRVKKRLHASATVVSVLAAVLAFPSASFAQVTVIISGGFSAAYRELLPEFERTTAIKITTTSGGSIGNGPNTIGGQLRRGVTADVVILAREGLSELIAEGRILPGTDTDLARSLIGMIVRAGAPKPDISTVAALTQTLLRAKSVAMSSSTSGVYLTTKLFPQLGIANEMAGKITTSGAAAVGKGEAEIGLQQVSEVLALPGVEFVGAIPADVQYVTVYAAAAVAGSKQIEASRRLIAFLAADDAAGAIKKSGMEPLRRRIP